MGSEQRTGARLSKGDTHSCLLSPERDGDKTSKTRLRHVYVGTSGKDRGRGGRYSSYDSEILLKNTPETLVDSWGSEQGYGEGCGEGCSEFLEQIQHFLRTAARSEHGLR